MSRLVSAKPESEAAAKAEHARHFAGIPWTRQDRRRLRRRLVGTASAVADCYDGLIRTMTASRQARGRCLACESAAARLSSYVLLYVRYDRQYAWQDDAKTCIFASRNPEPAPAARRTVYSRWARIIAGPPGPCPEHRSARAERA
jgi:hypothetical protein